MLAVGCGDETGVLVAITRDPATTPADIETLEVVIGASRADVTLPVKDGSSIAEISVVGRDLEASPYELLLRNGAGAEASVMVAVIARQGGQPVGFAAFTEPQVFVSGQVLKHTITLRRDLTLDLSPTGCVTWLGDSGRVQIAAPGDQDCDGDAAEVDCNDNDPAVGPSRTELCDNDVDDDCDTELDEESDADQDNVTNCAGDCDDNDAATRPNATEICDGKDNDCNDRCDDGVLDADLDGYNTCGEKILDDGTCQDGFTECNDGDKLVNPSATEVCDGKDNDCDGTCDVAQGIDVDGDRVSACGTVPNPDGPECIGPFEALKDCKDDNPDVRPGLAEVCDGEDTNCDGAREISEPCYAFDTPDSCHLGVRGCDDDGSDGSSGLDEVEGCVVTGIDPEMASSYCDAYAECEQQAPPPDDLFACANGAQAAKTGLDCTLFHNGLQLCDERQEPLPEVDAAQNCSWKLLGGKTQDHYEVGLINPVGGGGSQVDLGVCRAEFLVIDKLDFLPVADTFFIDYRDDTGAPPQTIQINITPKFMVPCPAEGLACTIAP
jgi:hypothetical protein